MSADQISNTQFIDFKIEQDNGQGRESVKIIREVGIILRIRIGSSVEDTGGMAT